MLQKRRVRRTFREVAEGPTGDIAARSAGGAADLGDAGGPIEVKLEIGLSKGVAIEVDATSSVWRRGRGTPAEKRVLRRLNFPLMTARDRP
jgi:hypothetical protein